ncbi:MAG: hypothetical protein SVG88_11170 [Halobacteriales archaeon]|nr:hypothetical protein [Halobacteriales archaeon]
MATDTTTASEQTTDSDGIIAAGWQFCKAVLRELSFLVGGAVWTGFWLIVVEAHLTDGDWTSVAVTGVIAMIGVGVVLWRIARFVRMDSFPRPMEPEVGQSTETAGE